MKASVAAASAAGTALHHHAAANVHHAPAHHPWLITLCVLFGLGVVALAVFWIRRCKSNVPRHEYTAVSLDNTAGLHCLQAPSIEDRPRQQVDEELAKYQRHLGLESRYFFTGSLGKIGARLNKQWFIVKDKHVDAERLLTLVDLPSAAPIKPNAATKQILMDLFRSLHHPYVLPILDVEFWDLTHGAGAAVVSPLSADGSLKDLIYRGEHYERRHAGRGRGLPYRQIQYLARQILEALSFLRARSFPKFYHLHAGNVIIQNGVARLAGLENTLFCLSLARKPAMDEVLAFGHLLFEMTTGCEPTDALLASPTALRRELDRSSAPEQIADVLTLIFDAHASAATNPGDGPSLDDIVRQEMFKGVELRELCRRTATALQPEMLKGVADLLHLIGDLQAGAGTATATATTAAAAPRAPTPAAAGGASIVADEVETDVFRRRYHHGDDAYEACDETLTVTIVGELGR